MPTSLTVFFLLFFSEAGSKITLKLLGHLHSKLLRVTDVSGSE